MLRIMRYVSKRIPRFVTRPAKIAGRMSTMSARTTLLTELTISKQQVATAATLTEAGLGLVRAGDYDLEKTADERPAYCTSKRWNTLFGAHEVCMTQIENELDDIWYKLAEQWSVEAGTPAVELRPSVIEYQSLGALTYWATLWVSGLNEEMLLFIGDHGMYNWHTDGWMVPYIGVPKRYKDELRSRYPFQTDLPVESHNWLRYPDEWPPLGPYDHVHQLPKKK